MLYLFFCLLALALAFLWVRSHIQGKELSLRLQIAASELEKNKNLESLLQEKERQLHSLDIKCQIAEEKILLLSQEQQTAKEAFQSLSLDALAKNNAIFLELARSTLEKFQEGARGDLEKRQHAISELFTPVNDSLKKLDTGIRELEKERKGVQEALKEQLRGLLESERQLKSETSKLVKALHSPAARGRWGEIQLRRVVELSGMLAYCDFFEQQQADEGRYRPDLIVRLPGGRQVVIDAKAPLEAYLDAIQIDDAQQKENKLKEHARQVRTHVTLLGKKAYWEHFEPTPEFVVLFLPAETFFSSALEHDPALIEAGAMQKVIIATPTTLIALLRAVSYGWKQENLSRHVEELHTLGKDLYKRLIDMNSHWTKMGRSLSSAVDAYNKGIGSLETRVLVSARKLKEMGITQGEIEIEPLEALEIVPRSPVTISSEDT
ncbi:MAG TPA: DNA recombination protein RmuC [Rhabdochlamydiaceae bacterium]|jgi:DNA recombination protein RmuC